MSKGIKTHSVDIGSLRLTHETSGESFHRFVGAIQAAARLGYGVRLRIVDSPVEARRGLTIPLDIYAECVKVDDA